MGGRFLVLAQCAPLSSSAPPGSLGSWLTKHLPAAPATRLAGGALLQLATTGARPARPEWAQRSASIRIMLGGLSLLPDLERYYKSSVPDSIAAAIWFTGTTKKSHAYVTVIDGLIILGGMVLPATFGVVISAASGCRPSTILALKIRRGGDIK
ncbi:hypothetical protein KY290_036507 [Solanum tuberosum]|uniref:Uncharacterized protein n=1 Tax=Solanum tuberosum TaxID=4113 RepID=A0ABQ7TSW3_SOLTU|nr:hypothetical protein KY285_035815 [Solanum tuberosum]KAH0737802.1 hypothetical protein KY290_036507 [Solanum tuberosum]